jgi:hypothetical protein
MANDSQTFNSQEAFAWIDQHPSYERATEITLAVREGIRPTWRSSDEKGWYARLDVSPSPSGEPIAECDHIHQTEDEAWTCAEELARSLVIEALSERRS